MSDDYTGKYSYKGNFNTNVDINGRSRDGTQWGRSSEWNTNSNQSDSGSSGNSAAAGAGGSFLVGLVIFCVIWMKFVEFLEKNRVSLLNLLHLKIKSQKRCSRI